MVLNQCLVVFLNLHVQKIDFANNLQLSLTLTAMSIGLWWLFDRSRSGFGLGISIAVIATVVSQLLVYHGIYRYELVLRAPSHLNCERQGRIKTTLGIFSSWHSRPTK